MVQQTIQFETVSLSEIGSGTITAFLFSGTTLAATLANIAENGTLKGRFTGTVDDIAAAEYRLVVKFDGYTVSEPDYMVTLLLAVGTYTAARLAVLDSSSLRAALGMSAADLDSQLDAILAASGGAGTGARTITITVNDGTTALQNAVVRLSEGLNTYRTLTNASGVAVFNVDDATYTVAVTKSGYTYAGTTLIVNGTETATYSMTAVSVTPPTNPDLSAVVVLCLGTDFEAESGVTIDLRIVTFPSGSTNTAYPGIKKTATSNGSGIATLYAPKGSVCEWKRGKEDSWTEITIGSGDQTNVTSIIGSRY